MSLKRVILMKKFTNLICILGTASLLTACSYFDTSEEPVDVTSTQPQAIDLTTGQAVEAQPLAPIEYKDVADVIHQSTDGRVQIFSLDDDTVTTPDSFNEGSYNTIDVNPVDAVPLYAQAGQNVLNPYPGVEIYPLDEAMTTYSRPLPTGGPTSLTPFPVAENQVGRGGDFVAVALPGGVPAMVYFAHGSSSLNQEDLALISSLARNYGPGAAQDISVAGHASVQSSLTDPVQRKIINLKVSMDRAFAVARALIESGIPPERIQTAAYGEERPPAPSDKPVEVAARRVEIYGVSVQ